MDAVPSIVEFEAASQLINAKRYYVHCNRWHISQLLMLLLDTRQSLVVDASSFVIEDVRRIVEVIRTVFIHCFSTH